MIAGRLSVCLLLIVYQHSRYVCGTRGNSGAGRDCVALDGRMRSHNTEWNPVINSSLMPCITCSCYDGRTECVKKVCPVLNCIGKKRKIKGRCCEVCRKKKRNGRRKDRKRKRKGKNDNENKPGSCRNTRGKENKKNDRKRRQNFRKVVRKRQRQPKVNKKGYCLKPDDGEVSVVDPDLPVIFRPKKNHTKTCVFKDFCLPEGTDYLVYRDMDENLNISYFAFDDMQSSNINLWLWDLTEIEGAKSGFNYSLGNFRELEYPASWFRNQISDDKIIFGAATIENLKTFRRRLLRTYSRCEKQTKKPCTTKILMQEILCAEFEEVVRRNCSRT